jgi:hypothetical protein
VIPDLPYTISIDGFSITFNETDPVIVALICESLLDLGKDPQFKNSIIKAGSRYQYRFTIRLPINHVKPTGFLLIEAGARLSGIADLRIEFRPAKTGPNGIQDVIALLDLITPYGGQHYIKYGTFTRYDIAIDLWGHSVDEVMAFSKRAQKLGVYTNRQGCPETVYMGSPRSNRSVAYTKIHKATGKQSLRIERRMKRRCVGFEFPFIADPFDVVRLVHTRSVLPHLTGVIPQLFFDSARLRGLNRVLALLPTAQQKAIKQVLEDPAQSMLPSTTEIWTGWAQLLEDNGLGFLIAQAEADASLVPDLPSVDESTEAIL